MEGGKGLKQEKTLEKAKVDNVYEIETDSVQWYLKQAGVGPLLTKEEEIELAYLIQEGSDEARQKMISSNLRLVINQAKKYVTYTQSLTLLDLIQEPMHHGGLSRQSHEQFQFWIKQYAYPYIFVKIYKK